MSPCKQKAQIFHSAWGALNKIRTVTETLDLIKKKRMAATEHLMQSVKRSKAIPQNLSGGDNGPKRSPGCKLETVVAFKAEEVTNFFSLKQSSALVDFSSVFSRTRNPLKERKL